MHPDHNPRPDDSALVAQVRAFTAQIEALDPKDLTPEDRQALTRLYRELRAWQAGDTGQ